MVRDLFFCVAATLSTSDKINLGPLISGDPEIRSFDLIEDSYSYIVPIFDVYDGSRAWSKFLWLKAKKGRILKHMRERMLKKPHRFGSLQGSTNGQSGADAFVWEYETIHFWRQKISNRSSLVQEFSMDSKFNVSILAERTSVRTNHNHDYKIDQSHEHSMFIFNKRHTYDMYPYNHDTNLRYNFEADEVSRASS